MSPWIPRGRVETQSFTNPEGPYTIMELVYMDPLGKLKSDYWDFFITVFFMDSGLGLSGYRVRDLRTHILRLWAQRPYYIRLLGCFDAQG